MAPGTPQWLQSLLSLPFPTSQIVRMNADSLALLRDVLKTHVLYPSHSGTENELGITSWLGVWALKSELWIQIPALPLTSYVTMDKEVTCQVDP